MDLEATRGADGLLPAYAWPGGYPISYLMHDGELMCAKCVNAEDTRTADGPDDSPGDGWLIVSADVVWEYEDHPPICCHCGSDIETAYGKVDDR